ncbi:MAG: hypothetical protein ACLR0U_06685 [Enterocloster clostridioformis]
MERHPKEPVFMMTPGGYVYLVPEQIGNLLAGESRIRKPVQLEGMCPDQGGGTSTADGGFSESCGRHLVCVDAVI